MKLRHKNLLIRLATVEDAPYLCKYWHESGWDISLEKACEMLATGTKQHIIEFDDRIIGDIHYGDLGEKTAEVGIFIRDENERGKGNGKRALAMYMYTLLHDLDYERIRLSTSVDNKGMRYIAENKFKLIGTVHENIYQEQTGTYESYIEYFLNKEDWPDGILTRSYNFDSIRKNETEER